MHRTIAFSGGFRYRPTTSTSFSSKRGSLESLNVSTRCGCRPRSRRPQGARCSRPQGSNAAGRWVLRRRAQSRATTTATTGGRCSSSSCPDSPSAAGPVSRRSSHCRIRERSSLSEQKRRAGAAKLRSVRSSGSRDQHRELARLAQHGAVGRPDDAILPDEPVLYHRRPEATEAKRMKAGGKRTSLKTASASASSGRSSAMPSHAPSSIGPS
jgi:hypothetical protein